MVAALGYDSSMALKVEFAKFAKRPMFVSLLTGFAIAAKNATEIGLFGLELNETRRVVSRQPNLLLTLNLIP